MVPATVTSPGDVMAMDAVSTGKLCVPGMELLAEVENSDDDVSVFDDDVDDCSVNVLERKRSVGGPVTETGVVGGVVFPLEGA